MSKYLVTFIGGPKDGMRRYCHELGSKWAFPLKDASGKMHVYRSSETRPQKVYYCGIESYEARQNH